VSDHVYKKIEITGTSPNSIEEAIQRAISKAAESLNHLRWNLLIGKKHVEAKCQHQYREQRAE